MSTALWEGLPFAVLEAMNMSKPLLLSSCLMKGSQSQLEVEGVDPSLREVQ